MIISVIKTQLTSLNASRLKQICKLKRIKGASKLKKLELINIICTYYAALVIQRKYRKRITLNDTCPFTLEKVRWPFWGKKSGRGFFYCNLRELSEFLVSSGDFRDPLTRQVYTETELASIEQMVIFYKVKLKKTIKFATTNKKYYRDIKDRSEQIDILMERIRYIFCVIRDKLDDVITGDELVNNLLLHMDNIYFPDASNCTRILASRCMKSLAITFGDVKMIIADIKIDCTVINKIKSHMNRWIEHQETIYEIV